MPVWPLTVGVARPHYEGTALKLCARKQKGIGQHLFGTGVCPAAFLNLPTGFPGWLLCVCECVLSVRRRVYVCVTVECASVFRRCCFPQPWSNSVVTQSPCERFPASVLPPVDSLSLTGWGAECVRRRPAQSQRAPSPPLPLHLLPPSHSPSHQDWFTMSTVVAVGSSDAHSRACILCAHPPDILYLPLNNCCTEVCICGFCGEEGHQGGICSWEIISLIMFYSSEGWRRKKSWTFAEYMHEEWLSLRQKMPPMLVLEGLFFWGKCLLDSLHTQCYPMGHSFLSVPACSSRHPDTILGWDQTRTQAHSHCLTIIHTHTHSLFSCLCWHLFCLCFLDR